MSSGERNSAAPQPIDRVGQAALYSCLQSLGLPRCGIVFGACLALHADRASFKLTRTPRNILAADRGAPDGVIVFDLRAWGCASDDGKVELILEALRSVEIQPGKNGKAAKDEIGRAIWWERGVKRGG